MGSVTLAGAHTSKKSKPVCGAIFTGYSHSIVAGGFELRS